MNRFLDFKTVLAILGITVPIIIFAISRKVKELSFKNIAITELVSDDDITDEAIQVFFDSKRVNNLYSISCIAKNTGNVPITKDDLIKNLKLTFPDSIKILKYSFALTPKTIEVADTFLVDNDFMISPDLLNPNNSIDFSFYVTSNSSESFLPAMTNRLLGGEVLNLNLDEEIKSKTKFQNRVFFSFEGLIFWIAFIYSFLYLILIFYGVYIDKSHGTESTIAKFFLFLLFSIGLLCSIFYLVQTRF